jgi:monoamine oxidase
LLRKLRFAPDLSLKKREALHASTYGSLVKTLLEFDSRFWATDGPFVRIEEGDLNSIWECTQATEGGILVLWSSLEQTPELRSLSEEERVNWSLRALDKVLPGCSEHFVKGRSFDWSASPFSAGGYSYFQRGYLTKHAQHLPTSENLLHFGGEHTSPFCGYMEGALESGHRVALEILKGK